MNLLQIATEIALDVGLEVPVQVAGSTEREHQEMLAIINASGQEIARRADWSALEKVQTITANGTDRAYPLAADYDRLIEGNAVTLSGNIIRGGLSSDEFNTLHTTVPGAATPRFFKVYGTKEIAFWPLPPDTTAITVYYQSKWWVTGRDMFAGDLEEPLIPHLVLIKAAQWRWRRQKGMEHVSYGSEYEAMMKDFAEFDDEDRTP